MCGAKVSDRDGAGMSISLGAPCARCHRPPTHRRRQVWSRRTGRFYGDGLFLEFRLVEEFRQPRNLLFQCPASCAPCLERDLVLPAFPDQAVDERFGRILQTRPRVFVLARRAADARQVGLVGLHAKVGRAARVEPFALVGRGVRRRRHVFCVCALKALCCCHVPLTPSAPNSRLQDSRGRI